MRLDAISKAPLSVSIQCFVVDLEETLFYIIMNGHLQGGCRRHV